MLVDCGATTHILNDESLFINFDKDFDSYCHIVEQPDRSKYNTGQQFFTFWMLSRFLQLI